jgi:cation-transporting P-type ATPase 13A2
MIAIILSVGPPYRQPMIQNGKPPLIVFSHSVPFMATIVIAVLVTTVAILLPPAWLASVLQLTYMSVSFAFLLIVIGLGNFALSWISEKFVFVQIRNVLNRILSWRRKKHWNGNSKLRRYQIVEEGM